MKKALIVVDVQCDFCTGGVLEVMDTKSLIAELQVYIELARRNGTLIVFTQDWHPLDHSTFRSNGGKWPVHCLADSAGAGLTPPLIASPGDLIVHKGMDRNSDGYSAFQSTALACHLRQFEIESVAVCGIATDYCVRATALDSAMEQWRTVLLTDLVRAVEGTEVNNVMQELIAAGVGLVSAKTWLT